jgi:hypothetical protein
MNIYNIGYNMNFYNTIDKVLSMNLDFVGTPCYNQNNYTFKVTKFFNKGNCCFKNKKGQSCPRVNTFFIHELGQCVCGYHLSKFEDIVINLIDFYKKYKVLYNNIFLYNNNKKLFIENLKEILYLLITHKREKYILIHIFNLVYHHLPNFEIYDKEYIYLVDAFYSLI